VKKILVIVALFLVAAGGFWWWKRSSAAKEAAAKPVVTAAVERGSLRQTVASTGKVVSNLDVEIKCKASGQIVKLPFDVSDPVRKGDLLLELDPKDEQQRVRQAEATVRASQARLVNAKESLGIAEETLKSDRQKADAGLAAAKARAADARSKAARTRELKEKRLASLEELETAETAATAAEADLETANARTEELKTQTRALEQARQQIRIAEAQVENDQVDLDLARQRLTDTRVLSPMDGTVTASSVQIGQIISSGISNVGGGTTALVVSDLSRIFALAAVDESDIGQVLAGQPAEVTVDAYPGKRFNGAVVRISPRGVNVSNVVTFEVKVEVTSPDKGLLRPEMTANVEVLVAERPDALLAPSDAIVRKGGRATVSVQKADGPTEEREVRTGISDGRRTEILSGLSAGEKVLVSNGGDSRWAGQQGSGRRPGMPIPH
jgi:multidrug efflux pump subunit AcrA (membrane-fusion protein)